MKTYTRWQDTPMDERLVIFMAYLMSSDEADMSFEEFNEEYKYYTLKGVKQLYMRGV